MIVEMTVIAGVAAAAAGTAVALGAVISFFTDRVGGADVQAVKDAGVPVSPFDERMITESKRVFGELFPGGPGLCCCLPIEEKMALMEEAAARLEELYGLQDENGQGRELKIRYFREASLNCGNYIFSEHVLELNIAYLEEGTPETLVMFLTAIVHEMRHAIQQKAVLEPGFWEVPDEVRKQWGNNMLHVIRAENDRMGYFSQPIERDAAAFSAFIVGEMGGSCFETT